MELFFDLLFTSVCVFIPKCGLFAGLNFEAIQVVLIDVLLLVYLIYVRPYRMEHYKSTVIILNAQLNASFTWKLTRTAFFCLPLWESNWKWISLSHCHLTSRSCLKDAPHSSWRSPVWAWRALKAGKRAEFCASDALLYPGVAIQVVLLFVRQFTQANWNVYWNAMTTLF